MWPLRAERDANSEKTKLLVIEKLSVRVRRTAPPECGLLPYQREQAAGAAGPNPGAAGPRQAHHYPAQ